MSEPSDTGASPAAVAAPVLRPHGVPGRLVVGLLAVALLLGGLLTALWMAGAPRSTARAGAGASTMDAVGLVQRQAAAEAPDTTVAETVEQVLASKLGLGAVAVEPELLRVFSAPGRDPRGWTISIAHSVRLRAGALAQANGELRPLTGLDGGLLFDHDEILIEAVGRIRARYEVSPDPDGLLEGPFTLLELRRLHEAVLGAPLRKDAFNWRMKDHLQGLVDDAGEPLTSRGVGRPAQLFTRVDGPNQRWRLPRASSLKAQADIPGRLG